MTETEPLRRELEWYKSLSDDLADKLANATPADEAARLRERVAGLQAQLAQARDENRRLHETGSTEQWLRLHDQIAALNRSARDMAGENARLRQELAAAREALAGVTGERLDASATVDRLRELCQRSVLAAVPVADVLAALDGTGSVA